MRTLAIDIETYSSVNLKTAGVHKYVEAPDFEILLFAYSIDGGIVTCIDVTKSKNPYWAKGNGPDGYLTIELLDALDSPTVQKTAFNTAFERACLAKFFSIELPPEQWECTMVKATMLGLPGGLDMVSKVLNLSQQKDASGKALIKYFSVPCKPTKTNGMRTRNLPEHAPDKWQRYIEYCRQDVVTEQAVRDKISFFEFPASEARLWALDQRINDTGVLIDTPFVQAAITMDATVKRMLEAEAAALTGLNNPNSLPQLKKWLSEETGDDIKQLTKDNVLDLLKKTDSASVTRLLNIRQELGKSSITKYKAMLARQQSDGRARGIIQFYGAGRTGRWAGRGFQGQNLPRITIKQLDFARRMVAAGSMDLINLLFDSIPDTLSQLIRTGIIAPPGSRLVVSDFSAIEAVVIAWLSGEAWRLDVFRSHGKIYEASAAKMFKIPEDTITKNHENYKYRSYGKVGELALGFGGGKGALETMCVTNKIDIPLKERRPLIKAWRTESPALCAMWQQLEDLAIKAVRSPPTYFNYAIPNGGGHLIFKMDKGLLFITLPSGRRLAYMRPRITYTEFVNYRLSIEFDGDPAGTVLFLKTSKAKQYNAQKLGEIISDEPVVKPSLRYEGLAKGMWATIDTYGGKITENIVQGIARDCLAEGLLRADAAGYKIVMHVHDEIVSEMPYERGSVAELCGLMAAPIPWAPGLPLKAVGYETEYYKKD